MSVCALCGRVVGVGATLHYLEHRVSTSSILQKRELFFMEPGLCVTCPACEAWLPDHKGELPEHLDPGPLLAEAQLPAATEQQLRLELEGHVRRLAAALTGDAQ